METNRSTIAIIGPGRLAHSLAGNFHRAGVAVKMVQGRSAEKRKAFAQEWDIPQHDAIGAPLPIDIDYVVIAVSDAAIPLVANQLTNSIRPGRVFVHTSGATHLEALAPLGESIGVFYPLQMFTGQKVVDLSEVPFFLEGNKTVYPIMEKLARAISSQVFPLASEQRQYLHLGAVWAVNFPNLLYRLTSEQISQQGVDFSVYRPILQEQLKRAFELGPQLSQTGPALRGDLPTLERHLALMQGNAELQELYRLLSQLINPDISFE